MATHIIGLGLADCRFRVSRKAVRDKNLPVLKSFDYEAWYCRLVFWTFSDSRPTASSPKLRLNLLPFRAPDFQSRGPAQGLLCVRF